MTCKDELTRCGQLLEHRHAGLSSNLWSQVEAMAEHLQNWKPDFGFLRLSRRETGLVR
jgi:hypothetical protein